MKLELKELIDLTKQLDPLDIFDLLVGQKTFEQTKDKETISGLDQEKVVE